MINSVIGWKKNLERKKDFSEVKKSKEVRFW